MHPNRLLPLRSAAVCLTVLASANAYSSGWDVKTKTRLGAQYEDNPALQPDFSDPVATNSAIAQVEALILKEEPNSSLEIAPRARATYYPDKDFEDLNRIDYFFRGAYSQSESLWNWSISANYDYQSILSSEDSDPTNPDDSGSGNFLQADDKRERYGVSPTLQWNPTQKDRVLVGVSYTNVDHKLEFTNRSDFETYGGSISYDRSLTERQSLGFFMTRSQTDSDRRGAVLACIDGTIPNLCPGVIVIDGTFINDSESESLNFTYNYNLTEITRLRASYGRQKTDIESGLVVPNDQLFNTATFKSNQYSLALITRERRYDWELNASRSIQPSSNGAPSDKNQIQSRLQYRFTPTLTGTVAALAYESESRSAFLRQETKFIRADLSLAWNLDRNWQVSGTYTYRSRDPQVVSLNAAESVNVTTNAARTNHSLSITMNYTFD